MRPARPLALALAAAACGPVPAREFGEQLFHVPELSESRFNAVACATCHATGPAQSDRIYPGGPLHGVTGRTRYWGGQELRLIDAVNFCLVQFMRGAPLAKEDPRAKALYEYLHALPAGPANVPFTVVKNVAEVPRGDKARGKAVYKAACQVCHGEPHTGDGRISDSAVILPEATSTYARDFPGVAPSLVVIEKVRHGQFFGVGGDMPPFSLEALSDADLGALLAFLGL